MENESFHFALSKNPQIILLGLGLGVGLEHGTQVHKYTKIQTTRVARLGFFVVVVVVFLLLLFHSGVAIALAVIISKALYCFTSDAREMFQNIQRTRQSCRRWCFCW